MIMPLAFSKKATTMPAFDVTAAQDALKRHQYLMYGLYAAGGLAALGVVYYLATKKSATPNRRRRRHSRGRR